MEYVEGKERFIESWGKLAINWGVNKTMGQVHALLLICPEPMCAEKIMKELEISRGNANTTLRKLIDWNLVRSTLFKEQEKNTLLLRKTCGR